MLSSSRFAARVTTLEFPVFRLLHALKFRGEIYEFYRALSLLCTIFYLYRRLICVCALVDEKIFVVLSFKRTRKDLVGTKKRTQLSPTGQNGRLHHVQRMFLYRHIYFDNLNMRNKMGDGLQWCHGCIFVCEIVTQTVVRTVEGGQILPKMADHSPRV